MTVPIQAPILKRVLDHLPVDAVFRALADPTRKALVERLSRGPAPVSALAQPFAMSLTAIGQHLTVLEEAGLVESQKIGRVRTCALKPNAFDVLEQWLTAHRLIAERRLDRLAALLDETYPPENLSSNNETDSRKDEKQ